MQHILVTGATGFIGKPLCARMLADGFTVRAAIWREEPVSLLQQGLGAVQVDSIGPDTDWAAALEGITTVVHLAARVHVMKETATDALSAYRRVNVFGTERLARLAAASGVKRFVFLSSVKVNGEESSESYTEESQPAPMDPYGVSKLEAEEVLRKIAAETGLEVVIIRPPLVYGPGVKANFYRLLKITASGAPLPLASASNARSMVYLDNLIDAVSLCVKHPLAAGETFLVSDGEDVSTPELIRRIAASLDCPARLIPFPPSFLRFAGRITGKAAVVDRLLGSLVVDTRKICGKLGWRPPFTMAEGLIKTAEWFKADSAAQALK